MFHPFFHLRSALVALAFIFGASTMATAETAFLEITLTVDAPNRPAAVEVYQKYLPIFLETVPGAQSKQLLVRDEDVQVLHGFASMADAKAYLASDLFAHDIVGALGPLLAADPEVRIYAAP